MKRIIHSSVLKISILLIFSIAVPYFVDLETNTVVTYEFALTTDIALFSLSLAITAIFFTVLDRYQQVLGCQNSKINTLIDTSLKEMGDNTLILLFTSVFTFITSLLETVFEQIKQIDINAIIIIFALLLTFLTIYDITRATVTLIKGLSYIRNR